MGPLFNAIKIAMRRRAGLRSAHAHAIRAYAGASHDFNPTITTRSMPSERQQAVFGMGMLAAAYCARLLTTGWRPRLRRLRIRFASRFWRATR